MGLFDTLLLYGSVGAGIAVATLLASEGAPRHARVFRVAMGFLFWPMHLPWLLAARGTEPPAASVPHDAMAAAIGQVERELAAAIAGLDGWAESVLAGPCLRANELSTAWKAQAERIRTMDRVLAADDAPAAPGSDELESDSRSHKSAAARQQNMQRLRTVRRQAHDDLLGSLAWVRELVSMIHLARFTGAPASRAGELVAQIAAAVEGLSEASGWQLPARPA
ncbi:MAG: hypothetical protein R3F56_25200 [Planctomycetota bacterium]